MEYVARMREKVGAERLLIPATAVAVLDDQGRLLLQLRGESRNWGLPGGLMDIGETLAESARRETLEETGLTVGALTFFGVFSGPRFENEYANGDRTAPVIMGFTTTEFRGELRPCAESPDLRFFPLDQLPEAMNPFHREMVEAFRDFLRGGGKEAVLR